MTGFDAELYLRLCGERGLINRDRNQGGLGDRALLEAARALISVGAIEGDEAAEIVAGYALARGFRDGRGMLAHYRRTAVRPPAATPPTERRIVSCNTTIERPTDVVRVRSVTLSESETRLSVVIQSPVGTRSRGRRAGAIQGTFTFQVADDRGGRSSTTFGGGGSDHEWRGQLTASQPLAVDTAWIELDGTRIELDDSPGPHAVTVERLPDARPVESFLWHWLATPQRHGPHVPLDAVLDALIAAGRLSADDPVVEAVRTVSERWQPRYLGANSPTALSVDAPAEWRSIVAPTPRRRAAQGTLVVAAAPAPFDGITLIVDTLTADTHGWELEVDITPGVAHGPFNLSLDDVRVAWWAVDDQGQYYLGQFGNFSGGADHVSGAVEFTLPLDSAAKAVTLLPTGPTERARIEVTLTWAEP